MTETPTPPPGWQLVAKPASLFRRYDFASYAETRDFLDRLADLSETLGLYPDLGFGRTHVNVTIHLPRDPTARETGMRFAAEAATLPQPELA